jgi:protocatechuate 3,4-dioxygenase beta subunit
VPAPYPGRTPHIHVKVYYEARGRLTTQLFVKGHGPNDIDFLYYALTAEQRRRVDMDLTPRTTASGKTFDAQIDLVLAA